MYYCQPHVQLMSDKLHELDAAAFKGSTKEAKDGKTQAKVDDGEVKADEVAVNGLEAYVKQRRILISAAQKVRRLPLFLVKVAQDGD